MVIDEPEVASIDPVSYPWSEPEFDFWRPVGEDYPRVLEAGPKASEGAWAKDVEIDLKGRQKIDADGYTKMRT